MRPEALIVFDGQSFNNQPRASFPTDAPFNVRTLALLAAQRSRRFGMVNAGVNGTSYTDRAPTVAMRVDQHLPRWASPIVVDFSGPTDLLENKTAAQILAIAEAYADARRAAGAAKVFTATVTPSAATYSGAQETQRVAYNAALVANANSKFTGIIDIAGLPHAADSTDLTYYQADTLHPTNALAAEMAQLVVDQLVGAGVA